VLRGCQWTPQAIQQIVNLKRKKEKRKFENKKNWFPSTVCIDSGVNPVGTKECDLWPTWATDDSPSRPETTLPKFHFGEKWDLQHIGNFHDVSKRLGVVLLVSMSSPHPRRQKLRRGKGGGVQCLGPISHIA